jgi:radical SAM superfamily enzyme YgiQ (UPF0313 family)
MNILIIENVWIGEKKYSLLEKFILTTFSILPTLHARQIAAITPKNHNVHVVNERYETIDFNKNYDLVHINFTTSTAKRAYQIADTFKAKKIPVVLSGLHANAVPDEAITHADAVLLGRGETNWNTLLTDYEKGTLQKIYPDQPYTKNHNIPPTNIKLPGFIITAAIEATRGCPYHCDFCPETNTHTNQQFYKRPIPDVIAEIKSIPQKTIMFYDASLTIDKQYTKQLFTQMKPLKKRFFCNGNINTLASDAELVHLSRQAGCIAWLIGFESLSQNTIDSVGKKTNTIQQYSQAINNIHKNNMAVIGCFMFGFDTDTKTVFWETLHQIKKLNIDVCDFCVLTPFPGTPIYKKLEKQQRILTKDWEKYNLKTVVFKPKQMTPEQIQTGIHYMYKQFYAAPYSIQRMIRCLRLGILPFFFITARTIIATMNK